MTIIATRPRVLIRAVVPSDQSALERFYAGLSVDSRSARFLGAASTLAPGTAFGFCHADHAHRQGLVAEVFGPDGRWRIVGHACPEPARRDEVEFAVAVADDWQHHGIGRALLEASIAWARRQGVDRLVATMRWSNVAMLGLLRSSGQPVHVGADDAGVVDVWLELTAPVPTVTPTRAPAQAA